MMPPFGRWFAVLALAAWAAALALPALLGLWAAHMLFSLLVNY
jgi:hypothetical protein